MNQTSRTNEPIHGDRLNQNPNPLSNDLITNQDLNGNVNSRTTRSPSTRSMDNSGDSVAEVSSVDENPDGKNLSASHITITAEDAPRVGGDDDGYPRSPKRSPLGRILYHIITFGKFVGPGFLVAVAYSK